MPDTQELKDKKRLREILSLGEIEILKKRERKEKGKEGKERDREVCDPIIKAAAALGL